MHTFFVVCNAVGVSNQQFRINTAANLQGHKIGSVWWSLLPFFYMQLLECKIEEVKSKKDTLKACAQAANLIIGTYLNLCIYNE